MSTREEIGDDIYPYIRSVGPEDVVIFALNTRLFKPTDVVNRHEPVHRIVAEYRAADYLVKRIEDPTNMLSIRRCVAIIAPNGAVRSELRGLLGWMASLGGRAIQEAVIDLDPYAVFANGDASQLLMPSKQRLLNGLEALAKVDPFFRRMDSWRRFAVAGFFSKEMIEHVRPLLAPAHAKSHLRALLLELLNATEAAIGLQPELRAILHDPQVEAVERELAYRNLNAILGYDGLADFDIIVDQASQDALEIASEMVEKAGIDHFGQSRVLRLVKTLAQIYPTDNARERVIGSRYFIRKLIATFGPTDTLYFLDKVTSDLACVCGKEKLHQCTCRTGRSKIVGLLLDRYFETMVGPHHAQQISRWTRSLVFRGHTGAERSASVQALRSNDGLRRAIQISALEGLRTQDEINNATVQFYLSTNHSGLGMQSGDYKAIVDHAVSTANNALWENFIVRHSPYSARKGVDELRSQMRQQSRQSTELLRIWARVERNHRDQIRRDYVRFGRSNRYYDRLEAKRKEDHFADLRKNRALIEAGQHWGWLKVLAQYYLFKADKPEEVVDDPAIIEKALLNCFDFLRSHVPSLGMLAEQRGTAFAMVLQAACLAVFRQRGTLEGIALDVLQAVRAEGVGGSGYREGEAGRFVSELDSLIFTTDGDAVAFVERLVEPQLTRADDSATQVYTLDNGPTFIRVKGAIALDWLTRYPNMPSAARETLFGIAAAHADKSRTECLDCVPMQ